MQLGMRFYFIMFTNGNEQWHKAAKVIFKPKLIYLKFGSAFLALLPTSPRKWAFLIMFGLPSIFNQCFLSWQEQSTQ